MVKISVIIPVYKVEDFLNKTISSVVGQTLTDIEIILVDDGSPDLCPEIIDRWGKKDSRITAIHKSNQGVTAARNDGLAIATGEYILFLDGDDYLELNALEKMYKRAKEVKADWVVGDFIIENTNGTSYMKKFPSFDVFNNIDFLNYCYSTPDFYYTGRLIRRDFIANTAIVVPCEITFGEDNLAVTQLASKVKVATIVNTPILHYVQREQSVTNRLSTKDLSKRAKALFLCYEMLVVLPYFNEINASVSSYLIYEYCNYMKLGFMPDTMKHIFHKCKSSARQKSLVNQLICLFSSVSIDFCLKSMTLVRRVKKII